MSPIYLKYVRKLLYLGAHIFGGSHFYWRKMKSRWIFLEQHFWRRKKVKINIPGAISLDPNHLATTQIAPFFRRVDRRHRHCGSTFSSHLCQGNFFLLFLKGGTGGAGGLSFINAFFMDKLFRHFDGFHLYAHRPSLFVVICYCYCFENFERTHTLLLSMSIIKILFCQ